jgi:flagellar basal body-associated protein FliL
LSRAQKSAWNLADEDGNIDIDKATKYAKQKQRTRNQVIALILAVSACLVAIGVMASKLGNQIASGNKEVQQKIEKTAVTNVAVDSAGLPHLTFKESGQGVVRVCIRL